MAHFIDQELVLSLEISRDPGGQPWSPIFHPVSDSSPLPPVLVFFLHLQKKNPWLCKGLESLQGEGITKVTCVHGGKNETRIHEARDAWVA